jgi:hypothetical protein
MGTLLPPVERFKAWHSGVSAHASSGITFSAAKPGKLAIASALASSSFFISIFL